MGKQISLSIALKCLCHVHPYSSIIYYENMQGYTYLKAIFISLKFLNLIDLKDQPSPRCATCPTCLCLYLASAWRFLWLDPVGINLYTTFYQNVPLCRRSTVTSIFDLVVASVSENWHLASPLARACRYQSVGENVIKLVIKYQVMI